MGAPRAMGAGEGWTSGGGRTRAINALQREPLNLRRSDSTLCPTPCSAHGVGVRARQREEDDEAVAVGFY